MNLDIRSILFLTVINVIFIISMLSAYTLLTKKKKWSMNMYIAGKIFQGLAILGLTYRTLIPDFASVYLSNVFLFIGLTIEVYSVTSFKGVFNKRKSLIFTAVVIIFTILFFFVRGSEDHIRVITISIFSFFIFIYGAWFFVLSEDKTRFRILIGIMSLSYALLFLARCINALILTHDFIIGVLFIDMITLFISNLFIILGSMGFLLILKENDEMVIEHDNILLKDLDRKKNKFFSIISHDLRGPIGNLIQLGQVLSESHKEMPNAKLDDIINMINQSSKKTYNLLNNLLQWAKSESGTLTVNIEEVKISEIISANLELLHENISAKKLDVQDSVNDELLVSADPNMIDTVVRNLLSNAVKFSHESGKITIWSETISNNKVQICIEDKGVGIDEKVRKKLFDLDSDYTSKGTTGETGTGLGLKLCKEFLEKNKGDITIESEPGKGTKMCMILPTP